MGFFIDIGFAKALGNNRAAKPKASAGAAGAMDGGFSVIGRCIWSSNPLPHIVYLPNHPFIYPQNKTFLSTSPLSVAQMVQGQHGVGTWAQKPPYATYQSPYGPNYRIGRNFHGISVGRAMKFGITAASYSAVGAIFALQFFSEVPKVRTDIMQKLPIVGEYFEREIPPEDNPF